MFLLLAKCWNSDLILQALSLAVITFLLGNIKGLFGVWHIRVFRAIGNHLVVKRRQRIQWVATGPEPLFRPVITASHSPLLECDFNGHKSNSTFYSDLDVNRLDLLCILFKDVMLSADPDTNLQRGFKRVSPVLGGVSCTFRKEIKPYQKYEVWSRVLSWDDKWIYIVSHFVLAGAVKIPPGYGLGDSVSTRLGKESDDTPHGSSMLLKKPAEADETTDSFSLPEDIIQKAVIASAISRYVFKEGRKSISPAAVFQAMGLPVRDETVSTGDGGSGAEALPATEDLAGVQKANKSNLYPATDANGNIDSAARTKTLPKVSHPEKESKTQSAARVASHSNKRRWDWNRMELERQRGLKMAHNFTELENLSRFLS